MAVEILVKELSKWRLVHFQRAPEPVLSLAAHYRILVKRFSTDFDSCGQAGRVVTFEPCFRLCLNAKHWQVYPTLVQRVLLKTFQKRSVSSPAPVTMASPSGETAWPQRVEECGISISARGQQTRCWFITNIKIACLNWCCATLGCLMLQLW